MRYILKLIISACFAISIFSCKAERAGNSDTDGTISAYLEQGYKEYLMFDEIEMRGLGEVSKAPLATNDPYVLVKQNNDSICVIRSDNLNDIRTYYRKPWGWYNHIITHTRIKGSSRVFVSDYSRYISDGKVMEFQTEELASGAKLRQLFIKTKSKCCVYAGDLSSNWTEDSLPQKEKLVLTDSLILLLKKGDENSYYVSTGKDKVWLYTYHARDTTIFSRSPGWGNPISHDDYKMDDQGYYNYAEKVPYHINGDSALIDYILENSSPMFKEYIQTNRVIIGFAVATDGKVKQRRVIIPRDAADIEKLICDKVDLKFVPGTIAGEPVPVWYMVAFGKKKYQSDWHYGELPQ